MSSGNIWGSWVGVKHGDEIEFLFGHPFSNTAHNYTESERTFSLKLMKYFTQFAKTGYTSFNIYQFLLAITRLNCTGTQ